ncbi:MAG: anti-sigma factor [Candidatus Woesearchaeota archaeon]
MQKLVLGIVILLVMSAVVIATQTGYTAETRYSWYQSTIVPRDIVFSSNRYWMNYVKPYGGYGAKAASRGSFGMKGEEEGASNLPYNDFIPRGSDPSAISNYYASARGYHIVNKYVELEPVGLGLVSRPQINGTPKGYARVVNIKDNGVGFPLATVFFRTKDLPPLAPEFLYELWLVDEDTGYSMSLGLFQPANIGRVASLDYKSVVPLWPFDSMMVTIEPFPDDNPMPGQVILSGLLKEGVRLP